MSAKSVDYISKDDFQKTRPKFIEFMDDLDTFLDHALANKLLKTSHKNEIKAPDNPDNQMRKLFDIIYKKLPDCSEKLISALEKSNHDQILALFQNPSEYKITSDPCGYVLLINNIEFETGKFPKRIGSETDVKNIRELFENFNFKVFSYENKTAEQMKEIIRRDVNEDCVTSKDCFVMFLMSHGELGKIVGVDCEKLPYSVIDEILLESKLSTKPKLIYINTCQCDKYTDKKSEYFKISDAYVHFATVGGGLGYRDKDEGTYFIQGLTNVYGKNKDKCDILSLSSEVNNEVKRRVDEKKTNIECEQISYTYSTLKKKVILRAT